jgi:hypothetical protein
MLICPASALGFRHFEMGCAIVAFSAGPSGGVRSRGAAEGSTLTINREFAIYIKDRESFQSRCCEKGWPPLADGGGGIEIDSSL